jgi:sugar phosphate isomerase/epimerase
MAPISNPIAIRDQIVPVPADGSLFDALRSVGVNSIECLVDLQEFLPYLRTSEAIAFHLRDDASIGALKKRMADEGVRICALLLATDFAGDHAGQHVEWAARVVRAAAALGVPVVRIDPWTVKRDLPPAMVLENFIRRAGALLAQTADTGVDLGMENHGNLFNDPELVDAVLAALPDERFGLTLDTGNFYWWGFPASEVYELIQRYAPRTKHTHIKNICYPPDLVERRREIGFEYKQYCGPLATGNLHLNRIVQLLRRGGYQRDLCIEDESLAKLPEPDRLNVLRQDVQALRDACEDAHGAT